MAAGLSLPFDRLGAFRAAFAAEIAARADAAAMLGVIHTDGALCGAELSLATARALRAAGPWGQGFPEALFDGEFLVSGARVLGDRHLKLALQTADGAVLDAIAFGHAASGNPPVHAGMRVLLAYRLEVNEFGGAERLQLNCEHVRPA